MPRPSRNVDLPGGDAVILLNHDMLELRLSHPWCLSVGEAESLQTRFAGSVEKSDRLPRTICLVAVADVWPKNCWKMVSRSAGPIGILSLQVYPESWSRNFRNVPGLLNS